MVTVGYDVMLLSLLACASVVDLKKRVIPDGIIVLMILLQVPLLFTLSFASWMEKLLGACLLGMPFFVAALFKPNHIGGGDIKLMAVLGLAIGVDAGVTMAFFLLVSLMSYAVVHAAYHKKKWSDIRLPLAPFIFMGTSFTLFLQWI